MSQKFHLDIDEEALLFMTEMMVLLYLASIKATCEEQASNKLGLLTIQMIPSLEESAKELLRKPLQFTEFRHRFNKHFEEHPSDLINTIGVSWLEDVLVFDTND